MLVSIIIPVHKTTPYLKQCVESALQQTHKEIEVLVICNGDLTMEECSKFLGIKNNKLKFINSKIGRHHARNKGMEVAQGTYLQFLDFDDFLFPTKIEQQLVAINHFSKQPVVSITKWNFLTARTFETKTVPLDFLFKEPCIDGLILFQLLGENKGYIMTASWLIARELIPSTVLWQDAPNDDALFISSVIKSNTSIVTVPSVLTTYRNHFDNTRLQRTHSELDKLIVSWKQITKNVSNMKHFLVQRYLYNAYHYMLKYSINCKGHQFIYLFFTFNVLGIKSKVGFVTLFKNNRLLLMKTLALIKNKFFK